MIRRPPRSTQSRSSAASDVYKRQGLAQVTCRLGIETSFVQATDLVGATLGVVVERVGVVAEREYARQQAWGLAPGAGVPSCLLVSLDRVLVPERTGWHEAKVGPLGPAVQHDRKTGRATLRLGVLCENPDLG